MTNPEEFPTLTLEDQGRGRCKSFNRIVSMKTMIILSLAVISSVLLGLRDQIQWFTFIISFNANNTRSEVF